MKGRKGKGRKAKKGTARAAASRRSRTKSASKSKAAKSKSARAGARRKTARKAAPRKAASKKSRRSAPHKRREVLGEGNYTASREFRQGEERFVRRNRGRIPAMGNAAEAALEGDEGPQLEEAEERARSHSHSPGEEV